MLAAGAGTRLRPLTILRPKALCPLGDRPLVDHALARFDGLTQSIAVNVHHGRDQLEAHLAGRVHLSFEEGGPLGTAGALGHLRDWIAGRLAVVVNADTWCPASLASLLDGWDGERIRILVAGATEFVPGVPVAGALLPWREVAALADAPGALTPLWLRAAASGRVDTVVLDDGVPFADCGTPASYLAANLRWSAGAPVIGTGAVVEGTVERSVVWPGAYVHPHEHLVDAIRADERITVLVR